MKSVKQIEKDIEATFKVLDTIEEVKVNHFFKHKVLQQLTHQQEEATFFIWFTPKLQMAILGLVLLLNISTIFYAFSAGEQTSETSLETFAQEYALQSETSSLLN